MIEHSPEAIAAFPSDLNSGMSVVYLRTAFDRGASSKAATQYAATREAIVETLAEFLPGTYPLGDTGYDVAGYMADALLAADGPLVDVRDVQRNIAEAIRANCTPSAEAYVKGGDFLIHAVADWVENPPEWFRTITEARA